MVSIKELQLFCSKRMPAIMFVLQMEKRVAPLDVRDNLMAEIRNAGGIRALRKTASPVNGQ